MLSNRFLGIATLKPRPPKLASGDAGKSAHLVGWKTSGLKMENGEVYLSPLTNNIHVSFDEDSKCAFIDDLRNDFPDWRVQKTLNKIHSPVAKFCTCGFYAYHDRDKAEVHKQNTIYSVLLEVAISGKYMNHTKGIRFHHQRVKKVIVRNCSFNCSNQAVLFNFNKITHSLEPSCLAHKTPNSYYYTHYSFASIQAKASKQVRNGFPDVVFETANGEQPWEKKETPISRVAEKTDIPAVLATIGTLIAISMVTVSIFDAPLVEAICKSIFNF